MNKRIFVLLSFFLLSTALQAQEPLFNILESELNRNFSILKKEPIPVYYISIRVSETESMGVAARFGNLQNTSIVPAKSRNITTSLRVGDYSLDNSHEIRGGSNNGLSVSSTQLPLDNNSQAIKMTLWAQLDALYKEGVQSFEQVKANIAVKAEKEDKSPDFTKEKAESYYEKPISFNSLNVDLNIWKEKVKKYSAVFDANKDIVDASATFFMTLSREYFIDTEGRKIAQNRVEYHLVLGVDGLADDGMILPLYKTWFAYSIDQLPSDEEVLEVAGQISQNISALKKAPIAESFTGPAILSPEASGVFFHEIFGHRVEASRMKQEDDAQTFKKKIGEKALPEYISVTFDPTINLFEKKPLNGYYLYDDEGIKSKKVEVVKNGVLKDFLMCRTPIEGFSKSNGHGRAQAGLTAISRQSNMLVESSKKFNNEELRQMLINEAKAQGKAYGYHIKDVSGGFTTTNCYTPNAFNVTPLIVYRVFVDGRPDELVRGVELIGTPLAMFAQIEACGNSYAIFNGTCGAESGGIPVSCIAPSLFVKRIETQKAPKSQSQPPVLPRP